MTKGGVAARQDLEGMEGGVRCGGKGPTHHSQTYAADLICSLELCSSYSFDVSSHIQMTEDLELVCIEEQYYGVYLFLYYTFG